MRGSRPYPAPGAPVVLILYLCIARFFPQSLYLSFESVSLSLCIVARNAPCLKETCAMARKHRLYSDDFKRQAVARMAASPGEVPALADELGVSRTLLYRWRRHYAALLSPPRYAVERGPGGEVSVPPGGEISAGPPDDQSLSDQNQRLRQLLLDTAIALVHAIRETTGSAPLNQLSAALGLVIDRLLKLEALAPRAPGPAGEEVIRIEYVDPDGTSHKSPPWARGDSAFEEPFSRGRVRSPFWQDRDGQADDSGDGPARG